MPFVDRPEPGFYKMRLVKKGPFVPIMIHWSIAKDPLTGEKLDRSAVLVAWIPGGRTRAAIEVWNSFAGRPIDRATFDAMISARKAALNGDTWRPEAEPGRAINLNELPPVLNKRI